MDGFEIISKLGDGSYSVVYKVKRKADDKIYALKKVRLLNLSEKEKENSLNEVRILASVRSTFVIAYKEAFIDENDQSLCIIMEYADKGDLYQKIVQFRKLKYLIEEVDVWRIFIQMTKGLKALHDLKILHRDLKSANIFLFSDGSAKIGDLNVSKVAHKGLGYTQTGTPIIHHQKYGMINHMILKVIYGVWHVYYMKCWLYILLLELRIWKDYIIKLLKDNMKKYVINILKIYQKC